MEEGSGPGKRSRTRGHPVAREGASRLSQPDAASLRTSLFWDETTQVVSFQGTLVPRKSPGRGAPANVALEAEAVAGPPGCLDAQARLSPTMSCVVMQSLAQTVQGNGDDAPSETRAFPQAFTPGLGPLVKHRHARV